MKQHSFRIERERDASIHVHTWQIAFKNIKGVVQIAHGMAEHIMRYEAFSAFLVDQGFIVYGNDHRGHGKSIIAPDDQGFFAEEDGFDKVVEDMRALTLHIQKEHPVLPLFLFGHSMGSFLSRRYIQLYGECITGVILSGTGGSQGLLGKVGYGIAKWERFRKGPRTPSPLMNQLSFGNFNKAFAPARTAFDFLSRDETEVDQYIADEQCGFICSTSFYIDLIHGIEQIHDKKAMNDIPRTLPIYLISGDMDPVGNYGKGIKQLFAMYKVMGFENIMMKLYPDARHELLNELNKEEVYYDILTWLDKHAAMKS